MRVMSQYNKKLFNLYMEDYDFNIILHIHTKYNKVHKSNY